jgi:hypothetical protein
MSGGEAASKVPWASTGIAAYWSFLVVDFLLHAVVLASWWRSTGGYWLPPADLFRRIPFGYASFLIYAGALVWLLVRLHGRRPGMARAARFGAVAGGIAGISWGLATYSVFSMPASALLVWPVATILESVLAATAGAWVLAAARPATRAGWIVIAGLLLVVAGVVAQNVLFPAPPTHLAG